MKHRSLRCLSGLVMLLSVLSHATAHVSSAGGATNTWIGVGSNASVAVNWELGHVPTSDEHILLSGGSLSNMVWDAGSNGLPDTVASWTQTSNYTGTVTFPVCYTNVPGATFTNFTVTGDAILNGGTWTHPQSLTLSSGSALTIAQLKTAEVYRLRATIGGNLTVGSGARIDASGKGYYHNAAGINITPSHGGQFSSATVGAYGDPAFPEEVGYPFNNGTDSIDKRAAGGGAICLTVGGTATVHGVIAVDGGLKGLSVGAGGSLIVQAPVVTGTGSLRAEGGAATNTTSTSGVGGRLAVLTDTPVDTGSLTLSASVVGRGICGGCGTIYLKDSTMTHGVLIVRDLKNTSTINSIGMCTPVSGDGNWTFDRVILGGVARLTVPAGKTLTLPNGLGSVSSTNTASATTLYRGLIYQGGTLDIGPGTTQVIESNWVFSATSNYVINADVKVRSGGAIGLPQIQQVLGNYVPPTNCLGLDLKVVGNLTVATNAFISGSQAGAMIDSNVLPAGYQIGAHGGRNSSSGTAFDSILNPRLPGLGQQNSYSYLRSGAALKLEVTGTLTLNGTATSDECPSTPYVGGAGSLNFTLGALAGSGTISAKAPGSCAGGRIAIRLTGAGSTFDAFGVTNIVASGAASVSKGTAGTVYLQTAADGEGGGLIVVRNNNSGNNSTNSTPVPANGAYADAAADLKNASLLVCSNALADLTLDLQLNAVTITPNSSLNLAGHTSQVRQLMVNGVRWRSGTYQASDFVAGISDSSAGKTGRIVVQGSGGTVILCY